MLSEDDAQGRALPWARQYGGGTTVQLTVAGDAWVAQALPPPSSRHAGRALLAVVTADGELRHWPAGTVEDVVAALATDAGGPSGHDARIGHLLRATGWAPGARLDDAELAPWEAEVSRLHEEVPLATPHETARAALLDVGGRVLTAPDRPAVHLVPTRHTFDPAGCDLAAEALGEPVAPVAVAADSWPTELHQGVSGAVVAVQVVAAYRVGDSLDAGLCTLLGVGRWVPVAA